MFSIIETDDIDSVCCVFVSSLTQHLKKKSAYAKLMFLREYIKFSVQKLAFIHIISSFEAIIQYSTHFLIPNTTAVWNNVSI